MLTNSGAKTNLLDSFYEHVSENDWLEGIDLYQAGKVISISSYEGLITGRISGLHASCEVRLKIHPGGHQIQWMECTCRKNRAKGVYCEHLAALMLHIDRENPGILGMLDGNMPLKPPAGAKKVRVKKTEEEERAAKSDVQAKLITHLNSSIHSISLLTKGPSIRVRMEIKEGHLTHYDLTLDDSAKYLKQKKGMKTASPEVKELKTYTNKALLGTRIYQTASEEIIAERVVAIKHTSRSAEKVEDINKIPTILERAKLFSSAVPKGKESLYEFITVKAGSKYIGKEFFFLPKRGYWPLDKQSLNDVWQEIPLKKKFKDDASAKLVASNFQDYLSAGPIWLDDNLKAPEIFVAPELSQIKIHSEKDGWFVLDPRYGTGQSSVSMAELMTQFKKKKRNFHKSNGSWFKIPELIKQYDWNVDETGKYLKVDALGLMRLRAAVGELDNFAGSKYLLNQMRNKVEFSPVGKLPSLQKSNLDLRGYQTEGLEWLWWLYENGLHGLLADEMGLGKTHQAMALMTCIQAKVEKPKFLVISPTTVLDHWHDKMMDFCPNLLPIKHHGPKRHYPESKLGTEIQTIITSYGVLLRDVKKLASIQWDAVILDEAHFVKNNATATYHAVCQLNGKIRVCLSGTPMENKISELKNIFDFLVPGYLGSDDYFRKKYIRPMIQDNDPEAELSLQKLIHPFKLRRTKVNVLKDLPAKVEDIRHSTLSDEQVKLYRDVVNLRASPLLQQMETDGTPIPYLHVFATLTMLKQICNHPALVKNVDDYKKYSSGKFDLLKELLFEALESDHKIVIYSQYIQMIKIISAYLTEENVKHVTLTGQTRKRGAVIKQFQEDPETKVFIGSLMAGGIGIDLTSASVVIHYDRWWNASKENQATDRVHRIGQNKNVQVLKLVTRGTLEEKIDAMIQSKQALFDKFMEKDEDLFKTLSRQDIIDLLQ